jgi:membrane fusion protein (multidrug efflux system)
VILIASLVLLVLNPWSPWESTDDAFLESRVTEVAPKVSGLVTGVYVRDNERVPAGRLLVEVDPRDWQDKVDRAQAGLALAQARRAGAQEHLRSAQITTAAGKSQAQAEVERARQALAQAEAEAAVAEAQRLRMAAEFERYQKLDARAISPQQLDLVRRNAEAAQAQVEASKTRVAAFRAAIAVAEAELASKEAGPFQVAEQAAEVRRATAEEAEARAVLAQAELDLSHTKVIAPVEGRVTRRSVETGNYVVPGQALLALVQPELWVVANFKETQLTRMRPGQPARIAIDARPGRWYPAHVDSIQAGSGARFSLLPPENATGNFVKIVQRVPVKIVLDSVPDALLGSVGPGMSVEAEVRIR